LEILESKNYGAQYINVRNYKLHTILTRGKVMNSSQSRL